MGLVVEKLTTSALSLAHDDEGPILVKDSLPGEEVILDTIVRKGGVRIATIKGVYRESPLRIEPVCPFYGKCGGCNFQIVNEHSSVFLKEQVVKETLKRIGKVENIPSISAPVYGEFIGHRSRCRFHVDIKTKSVGFLEESSNTLVPIDSCLALDSQLNSLLSDKKALLDIARKKILSGDKKTGSKYVEVEALSNGYEVSTGDDIHFNLLSREIVATSKLFFQSNIKLLPSMMEYIKENTVGDTVMDLYSGVGTFSSMFEESGKTLFSVERDKNALRYMRMNAPSSIVFTDDVLKWGKKSGRKPNTVIVDPPRVGLGEEVSRLIASWNPDRIIYVSCDPSTMARDITYMDPYRVDTLKVFDFYPGTGHIESVITLSRE